MARPRKAVFCCPRQSRLRPGSSALRITTTLPVRTCLTSPCRWPAFARLTSNIDLLHSFLFLLFRGPESLGERPAAEGAVIDPEVVVSPARRGTDEVFRADLVHDPAVVDPMLGSNVECSAIHGASQLITANHAQFLGVLIKAAARRPAASAGMTPACTTMRARPSFGIKSFGRRNNPCL